MEDKNAAFLAALAGLAESPTPSTRDEALLKAIVDRLSDMSESELPSVSATDNGDVLTVVEGAWAKAAPSGGGSGIFEAHFSVTSDGEQTSVTCDKTAVEIQAAQTAGQTLCAKVLWYETFPESTTFDWAVDSSTVSVEGTKVFVDTIGQTSEYDALVVYRISWDGTAWELLMSPYALTGAE